MVDEKRTSVQKILDYLKRNEIKAYAFEKACGLPNGIIYQWANGKSNPSLNSLLKISSHTAIALKEWLDD